MPEFTDREIGAKPFNWLKRLDKEAPKCPRARSWGNYDYFVFARYPHLQPKADPGDSTRKALGGGPGGFCDTLVKWGAKIFQIRGGRLTLKGLNPDSRRQLAALVVDIVADFEDCLEIAPWRAVLKMVNLRGHRWELQLKRKVAKIKAALEDLRNRADRVDDRLTEEYLRFGEERPRARNSTPVKGLLASAFSHAAEDCLNILAQVGRTSRASALTSGRIFHPALENLATLGMVKLYWFFHYGCGLSAGESEVRVARIRNALWGKFGVPKVSYRAAYGTVESKGCDAVRIAISRFLPPQGTSPQ